MAQKGSKLKMVCAIMSIDSLRSLSGSGGRVSRSFHFAYVEIRPSCSSF